jgi:hypothetical protein
MYPAGRWPRGAAQGKCCVVLTIYFFKYCAKFENIDINNAMQCYYYILSVKKYKLDRN